MVDMIFKYIATTVILAASIIIYTVLISRFLPKCLLLPVLRGSIGDRGVKKCVFPSGRSVTYEPMLAIRKYVSQYVLYSENEEKYIKCKINENVRKLVYELTLYDRKNKVLDTLVVSETVELSGYTASVMLPPETSYVHLQLSSVNGADVGKSVPETYRGENVLIYCVTVFALTVLEGLFANYFIVQIADVLLGYFVLVPSVDYMPPLLVILALSAVVAVLSFVLNVPPRSRMTWGKEKPEGK